MIGWITAALVIALMLPLLAIMYMDILVVKEEAKAQAEKVEKLIKKIERMHDD